MSIKYRHSRLMAKSGLLNWKQEKKKRTGIKTLKIKYSRVFGYALEVTNSFKDQVPDNYVRKQTLTNAERYITQELKDLEDLILGAEDRLYALEYELLQMSVTKLARSRTYPENCQGELQHWMCLPLLRLWQKRNNFVRPKIK